MNKTRLVMVAATLIATVAVGSLVGPSNMDPVDKWSWGENIGWMNWRDADGSNQGVVVDADHLHGFIWAENLGWINVGNGGGPYANTTGLDYGVNRLGNDDLDGMAWGENGGWINFGWAANSADPNRARFDSAANRFRGYAWGENIGWVNLDDATRFPGVEVTAPLPISVDAFEPGKERYISIILPAAGAGQDTAVRVELTSLYHPGSPLPVNPPDYSGSEGEYRYLNFLRDGQGDPVTSCQSSAAFQTFYACATLGCEPEYADWSGLFGGALLFVSGNEVIPDSTYQVAHLAASCLGVEETCGAASAEVGIATVRFGDSNGDLAVNVTDVVECVDVLKQIPTALFEYQCYVRDVAPVPHDNPVNITDIVLHVDALKLVPYVLSFSSCP